GCGEGEGQAAVPPEDRRAAVSQIENVITVGEPGSGKSVGTARDVLSWTGSAVVLDPHKDSLGRLVLTHKTGNVLYDRLDDLAHPLGYGLLRPSRLADAARRAQQNLRRAQVFVD